MLLGTGGESLVPPRSGLDVQEDQVGAAGIRETEVSEPVSVEVSGGHCVGDIELLPDRGVNPAS